MAQAARANGGFGSEDERADQAAENFIVYEVHQAYLANPPECIAILPFSVEDPGPEESAIERDDIEKVRRAFYANLAPQSKHDIELAKVDFTLARLATIGRAKDYAAVGESLRCNALMIGKITTYGAGFFGLYSRVAVGADVKIIRAGDGEVLWDGRHTAQSHGGDLPISPVGILFSVVSAVTNLHEEQLERVANDLARRLVSTIPDYQLAGIGGRASPSDKDIRYVAAKTLNFRSGPGEDYHVKGKLSYSDPVEVVGEPMNKTWLPVKTGDGRVGYVSAKFLKTAGGDI